MKKSRLILLLALGAVVLLGAGGGVAWWAMRAKLAAAHAAAGTEPGAAASAPAPVDKRPQKYVTLDKVIVMLKRSTGEATPHYLAVDIVLRSAGEQEKVTKEHLPMLRSVAVKSFSTLTAEQAGAMTIDQFAEMINVAYTETYERDQREKPFSEAMIGKLIVE